MAGRLPEYSYDGINFTFIDTSVRVLEELKCPICLELLLEPFVTNCYHLFCKGCIEGHYACPTCRKRSITTTPDVGSTRVLKAFKVKCSNSVEGCKWQGDLGDAEEHLEKCQHQKVKCPNGCGEKMKRKTVQLHTQDDCTHRPYKCPHCDHKGVYKDVTTVHYTTCGDFPLSCPTGCGKKIKRRNMESHLSTECPEEYISCKYIMFGCDTAVKRREKETHFSDKAFHFEKSMESQLAMFSCHMKCFQSPTHIRPDVTSLPLSFRPWLQNTPTCYPHPLWVVKLERFEEKKRNEEEWFSDPVYSHFGGYKMCLRIDSGGDGIGKGTHTSVYIFLMKGDNDDNLNFPFKGRIVVSLLNQLEDKNHHTREPWRPASKVTEDTSGRVTRGEKSDKGYGQPKFIPQNDLDYNSDKNCQYLKNDCLFFRVDKFECVL